MRGRPLLRGLLLLLLAVVIVVVLFTTVFPWVEQRFVTDPVVALGAAVIGA